MENLYIDGYLKNNLDFCKEKLKENWDNFFVVDGREGSGKSLFSRQIASYMDNTFKGEEALKRIVFTPEEFKEAVLNADRYQAIIFDEAFRGMSSRASMSKINKTINEMLMEMRQRNLIVFLVLPSFFELDKLAAIHRSLGLFHIYTGDNWKRGFFRFYDKKKKQSMYLRGKKFYSYCEKANFWGKFLNTFDPVDEKEYEKKKTESLNKLIKEEENLGRLERRYRDRVIELYRHLIEKHGYKQDQLAKINKISRQNVNELLNFYKG